jgi:phage tail-like protein
MSSRGTVTGLPVSRPIVHHLPSIYHDGMFIREFTAGLDDVLAPAISVLDCLHAYVDPALAPADFVEWLGGWVGTTLDEDWTLERRRLFLANAVAVYAARGTGQGLEDELELYTGGTSTVDDPGRIWTSSLPTDQTTRQERQTADRTVRVTVDVTDGGAVNWPALQAMVRSAVPAHLPVEIELRETAAAAPKRRGRPKQENGPA